MIESLREYVAAEGIEASVADDGLAAKRLLGEDAFDAVVTDLRMPGLDGLGLLRWIREEGPPIPVVIISAHGDVRDAVEAMKLGAYDYLVKPFDPDELVIRLRKAVGERRTSLRLAAGKLRFDEGGGLVESPAMVEVVRLIEKVAPTASTVLSYPGKAARQGSGGAPRTRAFEARWLLRPRQPRRSSGDSSGKRAFRA